MKWDVLVNIKNIPTGECTEESGLLSTFREEGFIQELAKNSSQVWQAALHQPPLNYQGRRRPGTLAKQRRGGPGNPVHLALGFSAKAWEFPTGLGPNLVWIASSVTLGKSFHLSEPQIPSLESGASYIPSPWYLMVTIQCNEEDVALSGVPATW